jgi:hypothetical protein
LICSRLERDDKAIKTNLMTLQFCWKFEVPIYF